MVLTRKTTVITLLVVVSVVFAGIIVGSILAQGGTNLKDALDPKGGDAEVVATVQGLEVKRGDIRRGADFWITMDPSTTQEEAISKSIVVVIDGFVAEAEVDRRELTPTPEEVKEYMSPHREACLASEECIEIIQGLGFDPNDNDYWEEIRLLEYGKSLGEIKLFRAVIEENGLMDADNETLASLRSSMISDLRGEAKIVWHDADLERAYNRALASE